MPGPASADGDPPPAVARSASSRGPRRARAAGPAAGPAPTPRTSSSGLPSARPIGRVRMLYPFAPLVSRPGRASRTAGGTMAASLRDRLRIGAGGAGRPGRARPAGHPAGARRQVRRQVRVRAAGRPAGRAPGGAVRGGHHRGAGPDAARAAGHGHLRQGRRDRARRRADEPAGRADQRRSRRRPPEELRHDFLWRIRRAVPPTRDARRLRPVALRGRAGRAGAPARARRRLVERRYDEIIARFERQLVADGVDGRQVLPAHLQGRAAGAAARPAGQPGQALEVQPERTI